MIHRTEMAEESHLSSVLNFISTITAENPLGSLEFIVTTTVALGLVIKCTQRGLLLAILFIHYGLIYTGISYQFNFIAFFAILITGIIFRDGKKIEVKTTKKKEVKKTMTKEQLVTKELITREYPQLQSNDVASLVFDYEGREVELLSCLADEFREEKELREEKEEETVTPLKYSPTKARVNLLQSARELHDQKKAEQIAAWERRHKL